jgi:hypothetical protein
MHIIVAKHEYIRPATVKTPYSVIIDNDNEDKEDYYGIDDDKAKLYLYFINQTAVDGGQWSASHPGCFTSRERGPGTHGVGCWVRPRTDLDCR